jgi:FMN reductase
VNTLGALRDIVHALRGWPTPLGAAINSSENVFDEAGNCLVPRVAQILDVIAAEVIGFVHTPRGE